MRLVFVCWPFEDQGSGLVIQGYSEAAKALGHEVVVYACHYDKIPLNYSLALGAADAVIFLFEWTTRQYYGDQLDVARLVAKVPRERRIVIDGDGNYNGVIAVEGDVNHADGAASKRWTEVCDSLSDKICQPTFHPRRANVRSFLFYAYNPGWQRPLNATAKEFGMAYVGHSKSRWKPLERVLRAIEPARKDIGRIALIGHGWDSPPEWATRMQIEDVYYADRTYLHSIGLEVLPAVPFPHVIDWMSKATFNPVLLRPTFAHLGLVTPRLFETPAANTIPLFVLDETQVRELYGPEALELRLPDKDPEEKIVDFLRRTEHYKGVVREVRRHLAAKHSHDVRLQELVKIIES